MIMSGSGSTRIFTAIVGIPLFITPMYLGGIWFTLLIAVVAAFAQIELYRLQSHLSWKPNVSAGLILGAVLILRADIEFATPVVLLLLVFLVLESSRQGPAGNPMARVGGTLTGVVYPALFLSFLPLIRSGLEESFGATEAFSITLFMIALIWICDTTAYYAGRAAGKTQLAPEISPNKTVEGAVAGVAGALIAAVAARFLFFPFLSWMDVSAFALIASVIGQLGDLVESSFKRSAKVKDAGSMLPGHGGFLDRFDSIILATPVYYLYLIMATDYL